MEQGYKYLLSYADIMLPLKKLKGNKLVPNRNIHGRPVREVFSWEAYPMKLPKPPKRAQNRTLGCVLILFFIIQSLLGAAFLLIPFTPRYVDNVDVTGRVFDAQGFPIPGIRVYVSGESGYVETDQDGWFIMENISPGTHTISFSHRGTVHSERVFIAAYNNPPVMLVHGEEREPILSGIQNWKQLDGLFFGLSMIMGMFALFSLFSYIHMRKSQSLPPSSSALAILTSVLVYTVGSIISYITIILFSLGILGLFLSIPILMSSKRQKIASPPSLRQR